MVVGSVPRGWRLQIQTRRIPRNRRGTGSGFAQSPGGRAVPVQALPDPGAGKGVVAGAAVVAYCWGRPNNPNMPGSVKATIRATPDAVTVSTCIACGRYAPPLPRR